MFRIYNIHLFLKRLANCQNVTRKYSKEKFSVTATFSNGRELLLETGNVARVANGAVVATQGNTSVLASAVSKPLASPPSFLPLTVYYRQKSAAARRIPSNYLRREMGITEQEILTGRVIDRSLRPLFPDGFRDETHLTFNFRSLDDVYAPDIVSINAASAALAVSSIPFGGPVGAVRIGYCGSEWFVNPTIKEMKNSSLDLVIAAGPNKTMVMMDGGGNNVPLPVMQKAVKLGVHECQVVVKAIQQLALKVGNEKTTFTNEAIPEDITNDISSECHASLVVILTDYSHHKQSRDQEIAAIRKKALAKLSSKFPTQYRLLEEAFNKLFKKIFRDLILNSEVRCDGRGPTELRHVSCSADLSPVLHGSSMFQRGQTQVECIVAYGSLHDRNDINPLLKATGGTKDSNFVLHYSFPQMATNDLERSGPLSRREVGHGALAAKALRPLIPPDLSMRVLLSATVLESNGSSSMSTVCGGSLAMYDAGVKLLAPAAGVAVGLVTDTDDDGNITRHKVLTDILGIEDYLGDMDFKIAGTKAGITALQADVKLPGLPLSIVMEALVASVSPRKKILQLMENELAKPRQSKSNWPVVTTIEVPPQRRAKLVGPGGTTLRKLQATAGVEIWWEDAAHICMFSPDRESHDEARELVDALLQENAPILEFGTIYSARVTEVRPSGVMVQLYDDMQPVLLPNSQLDIRRVHHPSALGIEVGESLKVKYFGRDVTTGQIRLSRRAIQAATQVVKTWISTTDTTSSLEAPNATNTDTVTTTDVDTIEKTNKL